MALKTEIQKNNIRPAKIAVWSWLAIASMTIYLGWRLFFTIPAHHTYGWIATILGIFLVMAEGGSMLEGIEHLLSLRKKTAPDMPVIPQSWYPHVDVFIATHNEDVELLYKTVNGCKHMQYPDQSKVHIYLCDDNSRPAVGELAEQMGVGYLPLAGNKHAKAGNLNNALSKTDSPYIVTLDADMIPTRDFLLEIVPYVFLPKMKQLEDGSWVERSEDELDEKYKIGFIQTPQSFYNPDLFQFNFFSEQRIPNEQDFFFRKINVGRNSANAPIYAGSNTLISREALNEIGGIAVGSITEDFETGIRIQKKGYTCYAVDKVLAHGLTPTDIDSLIKQRVRWGRGCVASLRRENILFTPHLSLGAKLSYLSCLSYWWTFFRRFFFIVSPILFAVVQIPSVICELWELLLIWLPSYLLYNYTLKMASGQLRTQRWSNIVDTTIFPYLLIPILLETLLISEKKFHVTNKTRSTEKRSDLQLAIPHILLLVTDLYALLVAVFSAIGSYNYGAAIMIFWLASNAMNLTMAIFFMAGRRNLRANDRFSVRVPIEIDYQGKKYYGVTNDLSETGLSFVLSSAEYIPHKKESLTLHLKTEQYESILTGCTVHVAPQDNSCWKYSISLDISPGPDKDAYYQILYDRDHSLAMSVSKTVGLFEDVFLNIRRRTTGNTASLRTLPRVDLDIVYAVKGGGHVRLLNCNYEFMLLRGEDMDLPENLVILLPHGEMHCTAVPSKKGLYCVDNWEELLFSEQFDALFAQAKQNRKVKEPVYV